jgi:hypothetical protein
MGDKRKRRGERPPARAKFYADHDFSQELAEQARRSTRPKLNIVTARELGFERREDEFHYAYAAEEERVLLTCDQGYLDDVRYKIDRTAGVVVFTGDVSDAANLKSLLDQVVAIGRFAGREFLARTKVMISRSQLYIRYRASRGCIAVLRLDRDKLASTWSGNCPECWTRVNEVADDEVQCCECGTTFDPSEL